MQCSPHSLRFSHPLTSPQITDLTKNFYGFWSLECKRQTYVGSQLNYKAISKQRIQVKWPEDVVDNIADEATKLSRFQEINDLISIVRSMLTSMSDGEVSISAYDTAWVALIRDIHGNNSPQFPSCLKWIVENQILDGSWGDRGIFLTHDRLICTLACVIALKAWDIHPEKRDKGMLFIRENLRKLETENEAHMLSGFEIVFPSLIEFAQEFGIELPNEHVAPVLQDIYAKRNIKLKNIPIDMMHKVPTTMLYSLEGVREGLDWKRLLKLQSSNGSFFYSPSSTAFAFMETKDESCLRYLTETVERFKGAVPNCYPSDLFERTWVVDRLQRLGISRYFETEIKDCLNYLFRYWTGLGLPWARHSTVTDIDDTSMGFRILRLHGYDVSADVFENFKKGDEFFSFAGQSTEAVTSMLSLYRASQMMFPGEEILEETKKFSSKFLREKQACNQLADKWIITKDLAGEVEYALEVPWYASLPRLETRFYIEHYGGEDDVWLAKTLYRMPYISNKVYEELAKLDYNNCQALHQLEWDGIQKWFTKCNFREWGLSRETLLDAYFLAAASIYEPERSNERIAWTKVAFLVEAVSSYFDSDEMFAEHRRAFVQEFITTSRSNHDVNSERCWKFEGVIRILHRNLNDLSLDALAVHGGDIGQHLFQAWENWMMCWDEGGDKYKQQAELIVRTIELSSGRWMSEDLSLESDDNEYKHLMELTNRICHQLGHIHNQKVHANGSYTHKGYITDLQIESDMKELMKRVVQNSPDGMDLRRKETFLTVAKCFYYRTFCDIGTMNSHIDKVLFQRVQ